MDDGTGMKAPPEEEGGIIAQGAHDVNWIIAVPAGTSQMSIQQLFAAHVSEGKRPHTAQA